MSTIWRFHILWLHKLDCIVYIGPWAARFAHPWWPGRFSNGSRWFSGIINWREEYHYWGLDADDSEVGR